MTYCCCLGCWLTRRCRRLWKTSALISLIEVFEVCRDSMCCYFSVAAHRYHYHFRCPPPLLVDTSRANERHANVFSSTPPEGVVQCMLQRFNCIRDSHRLPEDVSLDGEEEVDDGVSCCCNCCSHRRRHSCCLTHWIV